MQKRTIVVGLAVTAGLVMTGTAGAVASSVVTSHDIQNGAVHKVDLAPGVNTALKKAGHPGQAGADGKAGLANVTTGAGYNHTWVGDGGHDLQTIVNKCAAGQVALGGGFSTWGGDDTNESGLTYDLGGTNKDIQVTVSAPYTGEQYDASKYNGDIRPDRWVIKGYNLGSTDQIVRAWVICADAS
jgi:hypothetical protein